MPGCTPSFGPSWIWWLFQLCLSFVRKPKTIPMELLQNKTASKPGWGLLHQGSNLDLISLHLGCMLCQTELLWDELFMLQCWPAVAPPCVFLSRLSQGWPLEGLRVWVLVEPRRNLWWALQVSCFILWSQKCWRGGWPNTTEARRKLSKILGYVEWRICCDWWLNIWSRLARELMEAPWGII